MAPTVVVTGASGGIGEAMARAWGRLGATVVVSARDEEGLARSAREVETAGGRAIVQRADVTREEDRVALVERARAEEHLPHALMAKGLVRSRPS